MAGMIDSYEADILDYITSGAGTSVSPTNWFVALYTAAPNEDGTGGTEVTTAGGTLYERVSMASTDWADPSGGQPSTVSNTNAVTFAQAGASWGTVTHFGLCASAVEGTADVKIWGALDASKVVDTGDTVSFATGQLTIQLGDPGDTY